MYIPNYPQANAGLLYVNNLQLTWLSATTLSVAAGAARDQNNINDIILGAPVVINAANNGANGLDSGALADSKFYAVIVVGDSTQNNPTCAQLSLVVGNAAYKHGVLSPVLPGGYDMYRRIGYVLTDGSANILQFWQTGDDQARKMYYDAPISVANVSSDAATSYAEVNLSAAVPLVGQTEVGLIVSYTPATAGNTLELAPMGSTSTIGLVKVSGAITTHAQFLQAFMACSFVAVSTILTPEISYKAASTSDVLTLYINYYLDPL